MNTKSAFILASLAILSSADGAMTYEWTFNDGTLGDSFVNGTMAPVGGTITGIVDTNGASIPHIGGVPAKVLSVPAFTNPLDGFNLTLGATGPNGGGAYVNQYTFIFDLYSPGIPNWQALFQTDPANSTSNNNDADFYVAPDGAVGIGALTYSAPGVFQQNTWHRLAFTTDLGAGVATFYVDGIQVGQRTGASLLDGRFALYSNLDAGDDVRLFNEGDTSGVYTHDLFVNSVAFVDRELSAVEMSALGGASAAGILIPEPTAGFLILAAVGGWSSRRRRTGTQSR
jgi:hypothetical protein